MQRGYPGIFVSNIARLFMDNRDKEVLKIEDLKPGDQIVFTCWTLHPRYHAIVTEINKKENEVRVVRFTYFSGVVEEWLPFQRPIYKVVSNCLRGYEVSNDVYQPDEVVKRARSMKGTNRLRYSSWSNDCKDFTRWCKSGLKPSGAIEQYK
ncbi:hypothetical protein HOLleu_26564 [Holothuria leucospilota]|uniref:LRAT domain-containing protein n=1 Tax=Holothuria leucospilota TaxID=206669 RepID=A0A9Q1BP60_HOLLE|nr:hypothetical protein HOLleu_26564 [Holothuria leucospilota]